MLRLLKTPKIQLALALFLIFITALIRQPSFSLLFRFLIGIVMVISIDIAFLKFRKIESFFPSAGIVSALIIILLLAPNLSLVELTLTLLLAMFAKHFIRVDKKHIFNPAAFGLFLGGLIFGNAVSWWATSFQQLAINNYQLLFSFLILILPGYISCIKMRRSKIVASFLLTYGFFSYFLTKNITILDPTVLFFSLVMLPEPITTPNKPKTQVIFGIFVAVVSILISLPASNFQLLTSRLIPDPLIAALLVGNIIFFKWR